MTFTYNALAIATTPLSQVRFYINDTDEEAQLFQDEELSLLLSNFSSPFLAAAAAADSLAARYAGSVSKSIGPMSIQAQQKYDHYIALADRLRAQDSQLFGSSYPIPYFGGVSETDKDLVANANDRVDPAFSRDIHDLTVPVPSSLDPT